MPDRLHESRSKSAILINGERQYAGRDKALTMRSTGQIELARTHHDHVHIRGNATAAYAEVNPAITSVVQETGLRAGTLVQGHDQDAC